MKITPKVKKILSYYESDCPGIKVNLARLLMHGKLGGTGKMIILPVDQGFEHGPDRSFAANPAAYDPHYLFELAVDAGLSAYAAPLGALEAGADSFAGAVPLILKMNSANSLATGAGINQAITGSVNDALRLGCAAVGMTIYPGSDYTYDMFEEVREITEEAKSVGLAVVVWAYPRGSMSKDGETALDVVSYSAHMAALLGAHVIKVKLPTDHIEQKEAKAIFDRHPIKHDQLSDRVKHVMQACFTGRRIVVFSGGAAKNAEDVFNDAVAIRNGGGHGLIIGRNSFQRSKPEALALLTQLIKIFKNQD